MTMPYEVSRIVSAANSTNATSAKASRAKLFGVTGYNAAAAARYLKVYDKASAPTVGTDTPKMTITLPATTAFAIMMPERGVLFPTGLAYAMTVNAADNDTTALTAADVTGLNVIFG